MNYQQRMQLALEESYNQPYQGKVEPVNHGKSQADSRWTFADYLTAIED